MQPVRFSSTIRFVSQAQFNQLVDRERIPYRGFDFKQDPEAYTAGMLMCNGGGVQNGKLVTMFHLFPTPQGFGLMRSGLRNCIASLKYQGGNVRGFLTGGMSSFPQSIELRDTLKKTMLEEKLPLTLIWGQRRYGKTDAHYNAQTDTWTLNTRYARSGNSNRNLEVLTPQALADVFEQIDIAEGDTLQVGNQPVTEDELVAVKLAKAPFIRRIFEQLDQKKTKPKESA